MLELRSISKSYGSQVAVNQVSLTIQEGEFFSLLGPSGCGKTTLLRMLAGIETATSGEIWMGGKRIDTLPANQRQFNMVFQKYALFPHLSVRENIAFGLKMKKVSTREISQRVVESLALVQMESYADRSPQTLSGGQQQRVALARALVNRPKVLLLDEPLSALDLKLRQQMQLELVALQKRLKCTFIFVTHDQEEAMTLSDRIAVMNEGVLEQVGSGREIYENPNSAFVAKFIGTMNSIEVTVSSVENRVAQVKTAAGVGFSIPMDGEESWSPGQRATLMIRPEKTRITRNSSAFAGELSRVIYQGPSTQYLIEISPQVTISVQQPSFEVARADFKVGDRVNVEFPTDSIHLMPRS